MTINENISGSDNSPQIVGTALGGAGNRRTGGERDAAVGPGSGRIALQAGELGLLDGAPGLRKSLMALNLAARETTGGPLPHFAGLAPSGGGVVLHGEDEEPVLSRRLLDAGAAWIGSASSQADSPCRSSSIAWRRQFRRSMCGR
ncbi:AAA family ATPase [Tautonia plasticadhaerens]|uniref:AAA family ATPase n=1 Tax=Tautonia plasticadhaerens TaxID=2527974 RepID=UPI0011A69669